MRPFDSLHPLLRYHIVNTLGFRQLRPLQQAAVEPVLAGDHAVLLAPTAGGKTEAALFPVFSRLLSQSVSGLRVIYLCPIKALLNNLISRVTQYGQLLGLRVGVWHGDTPQGERKGILRDPPEILLTTPESLEVMLVSGKVDNPWFFRSVCTVIVDEIHAFAGDDRGRHLLAVIYRAGYYSEHHIQRLGLSATVGNPHELLSWLMAGDSQQGHVLNPQDTIRQKPEICLDYVGSLANAAHVISRLHQGEKRLVFCDSRTQVEELTVFLRGLGTKTFVSHGSLGIEERRLAEQAFAQQENCVIVATSTLELGIDVGDLDRVIQIDAPSTVASFLQRVGRTGRRQGTVANCLFLATSDNTFLRACALVRLWLDGYLEPVVAPPLPFHILAQQLMALCLERGAQPEYELIDFASGSFAELDREAVKSVLDYMKQESILQAGDGLVWMGEQGEAQFGRKNFMELFSVFVSPPHFKVFHGRKELGQVHEHSFRAPSSDETTVLTLGGRNWKVKQLDWSRKVAHVVPTDLPGKSRWLSAGLTLTVHFCRAMASVLGEHSLDEKLLTRRAVEHMQEVRSEFAWIEPGSMKLVINQTGEPQWWTFAGDLFNLAAAHYFRDQGFDVIADAVVLSFRDRQIEEEDVRAVVDSFMNLTPGDVRVPINEDMIRGLKFHSCLPKELVEHMCRMRLDVNNAFQAMAHIFKQ